MPGKEGGGMGIKRNLMISKSMGDHNNDIKIGYTSLMNTPASLKRPGKESGGMGIKRNLMIIQITIVLRWLYKLNGAIKRPKLY